jgi:hypothetical protein
MKPRPMGVVMPRAWMRSMICTPSIIDRVARSHSATTSTSPVPSASIAFSSCGRPLIALPVAVDFIAPLGAQGTDLAVQVLGARGHPCVANLAHLFRSRLSFQPGARFIGRFGDSTQRRSDLRAAGKARSGRETVELERTPFATL